MNIDELENIAANYNAPMYIFDSDIVTDTVEMFRRNLNTASKANINLCYAMKANPFLVNIMNELTDRIEVCSMGEFRICREKEITPEKLLISGVMKDRQDIYEILDCYGERCLYTAESLMQYSYFKEWCKANKKAVNVYLRLTSGNQFGMDKQTIRNIIREQINEEVNEKINEQVNEQINRQINENCSPHISGIHYFSGTQKKSMKKIREELTSLQEFICELEDTTGYHINELEYGPGIPVAYFEGQDNALEQHIKEVADIINEMQPDYKVTLEMGRAFAAGCGYYMTEVKDIKHSDDKNYCIVNGGMHQLNYDGQIRGMYMPHIRHIRSEVTDNTEPVKNWTICGELCTGNDVLVQKIAIDDLKAGDKFVFENTGAYSMTEGMALFLSHVLPAIAIYNKQDGIKIIRKEMETYKLNM